MRGTLMEYTISELHPIITLDDPPTAYLTLHLKSEGGALLNLRMKARQLENIEDAIGPALTDHARLYREAR